VVEMRKRIEDYITSLNRDMWDWKTIVGGFYENNMVLDCNFNIVIFFCVRIGDVMKSICEECKGHVNMVGRLQKMNLGNIPMWLCSKCKKKLFRVTR